MQPLFSDRSWHDYSEQLRIKAVAEVDKIDPSVLMGPPLDGALQTIAARYTLKVPTLKLKNKTGTREEERRAIRDFGETRSVMVPIIEIAIPFEGDTEAFNISPTRCQLGTQALLRRNALVFTVDDDDRVQSEVDKFIAEVNLNLERLREDVKEWRPHLITLLREAALARSDKLKSQRERDSKLDFPVG